MPDDDSIERQLLQELSQLARGFDMFGGRVTDERKNAAIHQYESILQRRAANEMERQRVAAEEERVRTERAKAEAEAEKLRAEAARVAADAEIEHRRLDIDEERVQIEKAALVVKALEVAVKAGVSGESLLQAVQQIGVKLLGADSKMPLALEDKEKAKTEEKT